VFARYDDQSLNSMAFQAYLLFGYRIWDLVLLAMLSYFLMSIIDSSVQSYLAKRDEEELAKLEKSLSKWDYLKYCWYCIDLILLSII